MWGKKMLQLIRTVGDPVQREQLSEETAIEERAKAAAYMTAAKRQFTAAVEAGMRGDADAEKLTRDALAAQEAARKALAQADATLAAIHEAKAKAQAEREAKELEARWKRVAELCKESAAQADAMQRGVDAIGRAYLRMAELNKQIGGLAPVARPHVLVQSWHEAIVSNFEMQLYLATEAGMGKSLGFYGLREMQEKDRRGNDRAPRLGDCLRALQRRVLLRDGVKAIELADAPVGPDAA